MAQTEIPYLMAKTWQDLVTWYFGIPSSSSYALIGGLVGTSIAYAASSIKILFN